MSIDRIRNHFDEASKVLESFNTDENLNLISHAIALMSSALLNGNKIISCGNGGSMCDAMHFAEELSGKFRNDRKALAALSISDPSHITCVANDYGFDEVFSRYVEAVGNKGDILLGISTSGNSQNILSAVDTAQGLKTKVIGFTGKTGGRLHGACDLSLVVPSDVTARIQEMHIVMGHLLCALIEVELGLDAA